MSLDTNRKLSLPLPPLTPATAAWLIDLCGQLQHHIFQTYGAEVEAYWAATQPHQLITGNSQKPRPRRPR